MIELSPHLARCLDAGDPFGAVLRLDGPTYREHKHRRTFRVELGGIAYFVKVHGNTSIGEILKNAVRARWPVLTARPERDAIRRLTTLGVRTVEVAGYGCRGRAPSGLESFIITRALDGATQVDHLVGPWNDLPARRRHALRRRVVEAVAGIARRMHADGINHRDFYLCHFLAPDRDWSACDPAAPLDLHLIDLHRARIRRAVPARWLVKDLAGLLFSAFDVKVTTREILRFLEIYEARPWRDAVAARRRFLRRVLRRAVRLYRAEHGTPPPLPAGLPSSA